MTFTAIKQRDCVQSIIRQPLNGGCGNRNFGTSLDEVVANLVTAQHINSSPTTPNECQRTKRNIQELAVICIFHPE